MGKVGMLSLLRAIINTKVREMFTGIVETMGRVSTILVDDIGITLIVDVGSDVLKGVKLGDSIAINGVCLTVVTIEGTLLTFGCSPETSRRTNLGSLVVSSSVNVERALCFGDRLGGHFVEGHVDVATPLLEKRIEGDSLWVRVALPTHLAPYIVEKGYVCLDGASLTICKVTETWFEVMLVEYTQGHIGIPGKTVGDLINLEVDILAKYVEKLGICGAVNVLQTQVEKEALSSKAL